MFDLSSVDIAEKLDRITEYWSPHVVGELNGQHVKLAKLRGEFIWHDHTDEDELFYVLKGELIILFRDPDEREVVIKEGSFIVVPRGVMHKPIAHEEVHVMLFEPSGTVNTGEVDHELTRRDLPRI